MNTFRNRVGGAIHSYLILLLRMELFGSGEGDKYYRGLGGKYELSIM